MRLVVVEWVDSHGQHGWNPIDSLEAKPLHCRSVGWLVKKANGMTVLASSISGEKNGDLRLFARGDIAIPDRCITKTRTIKP